MISRKIFECDIVSLYLLFHTKLQHVLTTHSKIGFLAGNGDVGDCARMWSWNWALSFRAKIDHQFSSLLIRQMAVLVHFCCRKSSRDFVFFCVTINQNPLLYIIWSCKGLNTILVDQKNDCEMKGIHFNFMFLFWSVFWLFTFSKVSRNLSVGKMAIKEKKVFVQKKKNVSSHLSPKSPNDLHTYSESPKSLECPGKLKTFEAVWDKSQLRTQKSIFSTVYGQVWEKKSWLAPQIFKLWSIG